jgi:leader peptidase (prepilin peptidase)/N-methyltransferase
MNSSSLLPAVAILGAIAGWWLAGLVTRREVARDTPDVHPAVVAAITGVLWMLLAWRLHEDGLAAAIPAYAIIASVLVVQSWIDIREHRLPRAITLLGVVAGGTALVVAALVVDEVERLPQAGGGLVIALAVVGGIYLISNAIYGRGVAFGFGDVLLSPLLGLTMGWLGLDLVIVGLVLAFVLASLVAAPTLLLRRASARSQMPFGPFLAAGTLLAVLVGEQLIDVAFT